MVDFGPVSQSFPPFGFGLEAETDPHFRPRSSSRTAPARISLIPGDAISRVPARGVTARYVRVTVTRMRNRQFQLSKLEAWSGGRMLPRAVRFTTRSMATLKDFLTPCRARARRRQVRTDNPGNIIPISKWRPVPYQAQVPTSGVRFG